MIVEKEAPEQLEAKLEGELEGEFEEDLVQDDAVIGHALKGSLWVILGAALVAGLIYWLLSGEKEAAPQQAIQAAAPETVTVQEEAPVVAFRDGTKQAGIRFQHENGATGDKLLPETMGSGVAVFDYDLDGDQDLLFVNGRPWPGARWTGALPTAALYRNDGSGHFEDVTAAAGLDIPLYGMGVAVGDLDGDGWPEVFLSAVGKNVLLRNEQGRFRDITEQAGVAGKAEDWSAGAGFFDADGDGDLDLFVCNYIHWSKEIDFQLDFRLTGVGRAYGPPQSFEGSFSYLYLNHGDGIFTDGSADAGIRVVNSATGVPVGKSLALGLTDVDGDGRIDVLVANDTVRNFFFHNLGGGKFEETGEFFGVAYDRDGNATGAMGVDAAYFRNGENLGFAIGNFANEMTSLYVSQDDPTFFVDDSIGAGIGAPSRLRLSFGVFFFDYDLDGRLDLFQANGHLEEEIGTVDPSQSYRQEPQLFWNTGTGGGFAQVEGEKVGDLHQALVGRGAAYGDLDGDGDLDVVVTQVKGAPLLLLNEQQLGHGWLRVKLEGKAPNREAIGAWVELHSGGVTQRRQVMPTRSYLSQVELPVTFGLAGAKTVDRLTIRWPDGSIQEVTEVPLNQTLVVRQGTAGGASSGG